MMLLRGKCYSCFTNGKTNGYAGTCLLRVAGSCTLRLACLLHWVPSSIALGRIKVSPQDFASQTIGFVIQAACRQCGGAMQMEGGCTGEHTPFTGDLEHLLSVLHVIYQRR